MIVDDSRLEKLTDYEVGWLAGMLDGEGSIQIQNVHKQAYQPRMSITSTTPGLVETICEMTGVGGTHDMPLRGNRKPLKAWAESTLVGVTVLLMKLTPHLIVKRERAELMLEFCTGKLTTNYKKEPEFYFTKLKELNRRGR